ncbi:hypothetical protein FHEFKHOI_00975 [Candidatus Methanoperedenaceae archaeon GB50]|nr:hypothetical protein FHEFKHOI_00975 [Candidatus Methanoperedenaceae archaeon GB50]CAD7778333.1 MAG: hypothetical protein KBONHNOK_01132 [Candidatus Methanoperedenaceae archaeon GB50]
MIERKLLTISLIVFIGITLMVTAAGAAIIEVVPLDQDIHEGDEFAVDVVVKPGGGEVFGVQYLLVFNMSVVRAETQVKGGFLTSDGNESEVVVNALNNTEGWVEYSETRINSTAGVTVNGTLATVTFTARGDKGALSYLNLSEVIMTDLSFSVINCTRVNGSVTIAENESPVANATVYDDFNNVGSKHLCKVYFDGSGSHDPDGEIASYTWSFGDGTYDTGVRCEHVYGSWNWNGSGYEPFHASLTVTDDGILPQVNTSYFDVVVYIAGDANGDGTVNIVDASIVGYEWGRSSSPPDTCWRDLPRGEWADRADLNNDHEVNILDMVIIGTRWKDTAW